jgi:hypothetical protein
MNIYGIAEGDTVIGFYARLHHAPEAFAAAVLAEYGETIQPDKVRHVWLRQIPGRSGGMYIREYAQRNGRGSFAATVVDC